MNDEYDYEEYEEFEGYTHEYFLNAQKITIQDVVDHITGPVISVVCHVILLALLGTIVVFQPPPQREEIEVEREDSTPVW